MASNWVQSGNRDGYGWVTSNADVAVSQLVRQFPWMVLDRVVVVTTWDSGPLHLTESECDLGWSTRNGIAYSPIVGSLEVGLLADRNAAWPEYSELYVLDAMTDIGREFDGELFEFDAQRGELLVFINFPGFALHHESGPHSQLTGWFWQQIDWMRPEGYLADSENHITAVHLDRGLIAQVGDWLSIQNARQSAAGL